MALIVFYFIIAIAYALERDWARAFYFVGAIIISLSVLAMR